MERTREIVLRTYPAESVAARIKFAERPPEGQVAPVLALLSHDPDEEVRRAVAISGQAGADVLDHLSRDSATNVAIVARARQTLEPSELVALSSTDDVLVLAAVAMNPNTPVEVKPMVARRLVHEANIETSRILAQDEATPADVLRDLAVHSSTRVRLTVAFNKAATRGVMSILASDSEAAIRAAAGRHPQLVLENLVALATDAESSVRAAIASNESTPPEILMRLASDADCRVVMGVVRNEGATSAVLQQVVDRHAERRHEKDAVGGIILGGDLLAEVAKNPNTPPGALEILADSRNAIRAAVAGNPSTPPNVLDALARTVREHVRLKGSPDMQSLDPEDERERILYAIVRNPTSSLETLQFLSRGDWVAGRTTTVSEREDGHTTNWTIWDSEATAAARQDMASWVLGEISKRQWSSGMDLGTRLKFAANGHTSSDILDALAQDSDDNVRRAVAANPSTRRDAFLHLAGDSVHAVRLAAANASHPPAASDRFYLRDAHYKDAFELLATDEQADVRAAVVANSDAFWSVLSEQAQERLVFDSSTEVREALVRSYLGRENPRLRADVSARAYGRLIELGDVEVWRAIAHDFCASAEILERLVDLEDVETTSAAVYRLDLGSESLVRLAGSAIPTVVTAILSRWDVMSAPSVTRILAGNTVTSPTELERLAYYTEDDETVGFAVRNPNFPEAVLVQLASGSDERFLRAIATSGRIVAAKVLAENPLASADVLASLATVPDAEVRQALIVNESTPAQVLLRLVRAGKTQKP